MNRPLNEEEEQRQLKRILSCLGMIYPDFKISGSVGNGCVMASVKVPGGMSIGMGLDVNRQTTNAEMLAELTSAAEACVTRHKGAIQPYAPGCPSVDTDWPEEKPITEPPPDDKIVIAMQGGNYARAFLRRWAWYEPYGFAGESLLRGFIPTHWRKLSSYERASLPSGTVADAVL